MNVDATYQNDQNELKQMREIPLGAIPGIIERAKGRLRRQLVADVQEWNYLVISLLRFQDEQLLSHPTESNLNWHRQTLRQLIAFGELLLAATEHPSFPNRQTHLTVSAKLQILRDDLELWHGVRSYQRSANFPVGGFLETYQTALTGSGRF